jgi:hypothetical protein
MDMQIEPGIKIAKCCDDIVTALHERSVRDWGGRGSKLPPKGVWMMGRHKPKPQNITHRQGKCVALFVNYCPFCGAQIKVVDSNDTKTEVLVLNKQLGWNE